MTSEVLDEFTASLLSHKSYVNINLPEKRRTFINMLEYRIHHHLLSG